MASGIEDGVKEEKEHVLIEFEDGWVPNSNTGFTLSGLNTLNPTLVLDDGTKMENIYDQISDVPFEELQKARSNGSFSFSLFPSSKLVPKRANKNRPSEMSSKKPVGRFREVIQAPKHIVRDPRFETLCGSYEESKFKKSYSFLYDEELPAEKKRLQELLRQEKSGAGTAEIEKHIKWIDTQLKEEQVRRKRDLNLREQKGKEKEAVKQGKKPFYTKNSETRKHQLIAKYKELKASGKLEAFLAKRRHKNAAKDHRYMPYRRQQHAVEVNYQ